MDLSGPFSLKRWQINELGVLLKNEVSIAYPPNTSLCILSFITFHFNFNEGQVQQRQSWHTDRSH